MKLIKFVAITLYRQKTESLLGIELEFPMSYEVLLSFVEKNYPAWEVIGCMSQVD